MMVRIDHNGQEPAGPMASALGYQEKSVERHPFHMRVISVLRDCAVLASLKTRSLLRPGATENTMTGIINPGVTHASTIKSRASSWL